MYKRKRAKGIAGDMCPEKVHRIIAIYRNRGYPEEIFSRNAEYILLQHGDNMFNN